MLFKNKRLFDSIDIVSLGILFLLNDAVNYFVVSFIWYIISICFCGMYVCWMLVRIFMLRKSYNCLFQSHYDVPKLWYVLDILALIMYCASLIMDTIINSGIVLFILDTIGIFCGIYMIAMSVQNFNDKSL